MKKPRARERGVTYVIPCWNCGEPHHASGGALCMPCYVARQYRVVEQAKRKGAKGKT